jgi:hypothetical protein
LRSSRITRQPRAANLGSTASRKARAAASVLASSTTTTSSAA